MMLTTCSDGNNTSALTAIESGIPLVQEIGSDVFTNVAGLTVRVYRSADKLR